MLPLSEIPYSNARRNLNLGQAQGLSTIYPKPLKKDESSKFMNKPSSIQSMLRNTTETGDLGQFSVKPSRVQTAIRRSSPASSSKSRHTPSRTRRIRSFHNESGAYNGPRSPMPSPNRSRSSSFGQRPFRGPYQAPSFEDYQAYSMTQSSYTSHSLTHRYPYGVGHHYNRLDLQNGRPRSPFAYPTRLKRPGYRPSSPSLSELNRLQAHGHANSQRDPTYRTASPSVGYYPTRTPSPWPYGFNRSDPMLRHYPPTMGARLKENSSPSSVSKPTITPKPSSSLKSVASSSQLRHTQSGANLARSWAHSQPPSPIFYDYSEAFNDQDDYATMSVSSAVLFEQTAPEAASTSQSELDESPDSTISSEIQGSDTCLEILDQKNDQASNRGPSRVKSVAGGWIRATGQDLSDVLEMSEKDGPSEQGEINSNIDPNANEVRQYESSDVPIQCAPTLKNVEQNLPRGDIDTMDSLNTSSQDHVHDLDRSPRTDAMILAILSPNLNHTLSTPEPVEDPYDGTARAPKANASNTPEHPISTPERINTCPSESARASSSECRSRAGLRQILSPTPERSINSSAARDRFSKILSIDESDLVPDHIDISNKTDDCMNSPMESTRTGNIVLTDAGIHWRKYSSCFRTEHSPASKTLVEESDSDEEPDFTTALRATFCKNDAIFSECPAESSPNTIPSQSSQLQPQASLRIIRRSTSVHPATDMPAKADSVYDTTDQGAKVAVRPIASNIDDRKIERLFHVCKESPPLLEELPSFVSSSSPPIATSLPVLLSTLPPLVEYLGKDPTMAELEAVTSSYLSRESMSSKLNEPQRPMMDVKELCKRESLTASSSTQQIMHPDRASATSPLSSRPWNLDTSYPWDDHIPRLEVNLPLENDGAIKHSEDTPRFRFRLQRASTLGGRAKMHSKRFSATEEDCSTFDSSDILPGPSFRRKKNPQMAIFPTNINSSHDVIRSSLQGARFVESFEEDSPRTNLMPPSPAQEARSFFSDDSSIPRPKGSLRKRLSDFRARTSRSTSMDQTRGYDRGLLSSAFGISRASGRSSRLSERTAAGPSRDSQAKGTRSNVVTKLRLWFQPLEDRVRDWRWRIRYRKDRCRAATSTTL